MKKRFEEHLKKIDADKDGKISKEEAPERLAKVFDKVDADTDGFVTPQEIKDSIKARMKEHFKKGPEAKGGDQGDCPKGKCPKEKGPKGKGPKGPDMKKDDQKGPPKGEGQHARRGGPDGPKGDRPRLSPEEMKKRFEEHLKKIDTDKDGKISKEEAPERMAKAFDKIDADGDGFVTPDEIKASWKDRMEEHAKRMKERAEKAAPEKPEEK